LIEIVLSAIKDALSEICPVIVYSPCFRGRVYIFVETSVLHTSLGPGEKYGRFDQDVDPSPTLNRPVSSSTPGSPGARTVFVDVHKVERPLRN